MHNPLENFAKTAVNLQTLYDTKSDYLNRDRYGETHPGLQYFLIEKKKTKICHTFYLAVRLFLEPVIMFSLLFVFV